MAKLRKMLGSIEDETVQALMRLIETQSVRTLSLWATEYVSIHYLPLLATEDKPADARFSVAAEAVRAWGRGEVTLKAAKAAISAGRTAAREYTAPAETAAAYAVATGCAALSTPTNALGFAFYGAAAYAYSQAGTEAERAVHDALAQEELKRILESLQAAAVADEQNPAKINWNC